MPSEHLEPQPYRVQQGHLSKRDLFTEQEKLIATFNSPQECADFVAMHNRLIDKIDLLEYELKEALEYKYMYEDLCR